MTKTDKRDKKYQKLDKKKEQKVEKREEKKLDKKIENREKKKVDKKVEKREENKDKRHNKSLLCDSDSDENNDRKDIDETIDESKNKGKYKKRFNNTNDKEQRLSFKDGYVRPKFTPSDLLSAEEIKKRLFNFEKVKTEDIPNLGINLRIQYFEVIDGDKFKYKPGGRIIQNKAPDYLLISNGRFNWSLQLDKHIIFAELTTEKVKMEYEQKLQQKDREIEHLRALIRKQKKIIEELTNN